MPYGYRQPNSPDVDGAAQRLNPLESACLQQTDRTNKTHIPGAEEAPIIRLGGDTNHTDYCRSREVGGGGSEGADHAPSSGNDR